jgi:DNA-binding NarL/FixJ family response regulator
LDDSVLSLTPALIVEDDVAMQVRLTRLLSSVVGGSEDIVVAGSLCAARELLLHRSFTAAFVDIGLPDGNGCELIAWLQAHQPEVTSLVISAWGNEDTVLAALKAGAIGYLLKEREDIEIELSIRSVLRGGAPIDPVIARRILTLLPAAPPTPKPDQPAFHLTPREQEILELVARGNSNIEIAEALSLSRLTVEGYTKAIYRKLVVGSRTAAVHAARSQGLLG